MARRLEDWAHSLAEDHAQADAVKDLFFKRSLYSSTADFFAALLETFPDGAELEPGVLQLLVAELRGVWGAEKAVEEGELPEHIAFWKQLSERTGMVQIPPFDDPDVIAAARRVVTLRDGQIASDERR